MLPLGWVTLIPGGFLLYKTHRKTITISTDEGDYNLEFNPTVPRGWTAITSVVADHIHGIDFARAMAVQDKEAAAVQWLATQAELADKYIEAIGTAVSPDSFEACHDVLRHVDISALASIANILIGEYSSYHKEALAEAKEGFEP